MQAPFLTGLSLIVPFNSILSTVRQTEGRRIKLMLIELNVFFLFRVAPDLFTANMVCNSLCLAGVPDDRRAE